MVKFICAYFVCMIHITPFRGNIIPYERYVIFFLQQYISRLAVPFYFTAAGFFLFRKMELQRLDYDKIKRYCFKILRLTGVWYVLLTEGGKGQLWYLGGLVVGVLVFVFLQKYMKIKHMLIIAGLLYCIGLLGDSYNGWIAPYMDRNILRQVSMLYEIFFVTTRNGVFFGFPYILMGALLAHREFFIKMKTAVLGLFVSLLGLLIELMLLKGYSAPKDYNMMVFLLPSTFFLFYIAMHFQLKDRPIYKRLRVIGILIYFVHLFVHYFVTVGNEIIEKYLDIDLSNYVFFVTIIMVTVLAAFIEWLSHKKGFTGLRYLYS